MLDELIAESVARRTLLESTILDREMLDVQEQNAASAYIREHADFTAYHVLFALRRTTETLYQSIPASVRAAILCSALAELTYLNDWGHLTVNPSVGVPAAALVELGQAALDCLMERLSDCRPAPFFGSADATVAAQYRRCDFAYRAAATILGKSTHFAPTTTERDAAIEQLRSR